ncbi:MAG: two-component sensor histidine kinase [Lachnospiraceae bacterium]|nr:two-component sensor histidine kinase [Lachnospiraceae bacterium]
MVKVLRDNSVETEMMLNRKNIQLIKHQNETIYIATLKERNRIAREIHDNVGHMLSRSILQVGALLTICKDEVIKVHLDSLKSTLDDAMNSIRSSVHDLHDESIDFTDAVHDLVGHFTFCPVKLECDISRDVPKEIKYCFLAILKEALNNTIKHSNATTVSITLREQPGFYQLLMEDNGTILPDLNTDAAGIGLSNMRNRVDALHGILHISADHGFRIFVSVPKKS